MLVRHVLAAPRSDDHRLPVDASFPTGVIPERPVTPAASPPSDDEIVPRVPVVPARGAVRSDFLSPTAPA